jgi:hypothetical protein
MGVGVGAADGLAGHLKNLAKQISVDVRSKL